ncbi:MAG: DAK2 domain-containing protein [Marinifilaceae bacterium]
MSLTLQQFQSMLQLALSNVKAREEEFSKLDAHAGDGDHGTAIVTAMNVLVSEAQKATDFPSMFNDMGMEVMMQTSGSTSTLLGAFFMGMGENDKVAGAELNAEAVKAMFVSGLKGVQEQTKAQVGDKTIMDALIPAVEAINACPSEDIATILNAGATAALAGAEATTDMQAKFGRARNLGERSKGFPDAGATSWASIFESFAKGYK